MNEQSEIPHVEGRRAGRRRYEATVLFRAGHRRANVKASDISKLGARISGVFLVRVDERFFLKIGTIEPIEARVVWVTDFEFGCEFMRPISDVVLDAITSHRI